MAESSEDLYAGLSGLVLGQPKIDLGHGMTIRQTYAHMFSPYMMAFKPAPNGGPHPAPWRAASGGFGRDITSELHVPAMGSVGLRTPHDVLWAVVFAIRLGVEPAAELTALSNRSLIAEIDPKEKGVWLSPIEVGAKHFALSIESGVLDANRASWVSSRWPIALRLLKEHAEFALAVDAIMTGPYIQRPPLILVSLWAALEAIFSPSTSELRFRVSSLVAAYLEPPGEERRKRARDVARLYDKRSAAAHGKPSHDTSHILDSFNLVRSVLIKILDEGEVPTKERLDGLLYGVHGP